MSNLHEDLAADLQVRIDEHVEGVTHHAFGRVLDRHDPVIRLPLLHLGKDLADAPERDVFRQQAESVHARHVGEGGLGPEVGHLQRLLERKTGREDFPVDCLDRSVREGSPALPREAIDDLSLPLRGMVGDVSLGLLLPHAHDDLGPAIQEVQDLAIDGIDLPSKLLDSHLCPLWFLRPHLDLKPGHYREESRAASRVFSLRLDGAICLLAGRHEGLELLS